MNTTKTAEIQDSELSWNHKGTRNVFEWKLTP